MKPAFQEIIDAGIGDCFSACLASLLELPISAVPKFRRDNPAPKDMMKEARKWLAKNYGLSIITLQMEDRESDYIGSDLRIIGAFPETPCIAGGTSPNLPDASHAIVGQLDKQGRNFEMTHDPNPSGKGIVGYPKHLYFLVSLKPDEIVRQIESERAKLKAA